MATHHSAFVSYNRMQLMKCISIIIFQLHGRNDGEQHHYAVAVVAAAAAGGVSRQQNERNDDVIVKNRFCACTATYF